MSYETLIVETAPGGVEGVLRIRLNRPQALNALNARLTHTLSGPFNADRLSH
jgi:enoyl-CoA hydratase